MPYSASYIRDKLLTNDQWLARALVALNERQTSDEQIHEVTKYRNEQGFRPAHAQKGTGMAMFYKRHGFLTPKQIAWWRKVTPCGKSRIEIYVGQLMTIAATKQKSD
jgi:hypothetical protein